MDRTVQKTDIAVLIEDPGQVDIQRLLGRHFKAMNGQSPPGSVHMLDLEALRMPTITFYAARRNSLLLGCGALKRLDDQHGEIKSMHTATEARGSGVARLLLARIVDDAVSSGYRRLSLETGSARMFAPARSLYEGAGFMHCDPFADYLPDPHSVFLTLEL